MLENKTEPVKPKHNFALSHNMKTLKLHGQWFDRTTCNEPGCPAWPYTLTPVKDIRPKEEDDGGTGT